MTRKDFKEKYLTNSYFLVNKENYIEVQEIFQTFNIETNSRNGFLNLDEEKTNLVIFPANDFHKNGYYQKVDMFTPNKNYGEIKDVEHFLIDFRLLPKRKNISHLLLKEKDDFIVRNNISYLVWEEKDGFIVRNNINIFCNKREAIEHAKYLISRQLGEERDCMLIKMSKMIELKSFNRKKT